MHKDSQKQLKKESSEVGIDLNNRKKKEYKIALVSMAWFGVITQTKRSPVQSVARARARVLGLVPGRVHVGGNQSVFLSPSLPSPL